MTPSQSVNLILTNLRLLDYPQHDPDSFPITAEVFTSLQNKGKAFEHIIHHLLKCYDEVECETRLKDCWPVYEPSQSRALRNNVFAWLEELKRNGKLPGVLIRRTTLDDCGGQRYEELLQALSTMVVKTRAERNGYGSVDKTYGYKQATSTSPSPTVLQVLNLAHEYGIRKALSERTNQKSRWRSFTKLLDEKEEEIEQLAASIPEDPEPAEPPPRRPRGYEESIRARWRNNWLGDAQLLDTILDGDPEDTRDRFFEVDFETALERQDRFRKPDAKGGVLQELQRKREAQNAKVEQMRRLRERIGMTGGSPRKRESVQVVQKRGLKVEFNRHQELRVENIRIEPKAVPVEGSEYAELLNSLREELMLASGPRPRDKEPEARKEYIRYQPPQQEDVSMTMDDPMDISMYAPPSAQPNQERRDSRDEERPATPGSDTIYRQTHDEYGLTLDYDAEAHGREYDDGDVSMQDMLGMMGSPAKQSSPRRRGQSKNEEYSDYGERPIRSPQNVERQPSPEKPPSWVSDQMDLDDFSDGGLSEIMIPPSLTSKTTLQSEQPGPNGSPRRVEIRDEVDVYSQSNQRRQMASDVEEDDNDPFMREALDCADDAQTVVRHPSRRSSPVHSFDDIPRAYESVRRRSQRMSIHGYVEDGLVDEDDEEEEEEPPAPSHHSSFRYSEDHSRVSNLTDDHPPGKAFLEPQSQLRPRGRGFDEDLIAEKIVSSMAAGSFSPDKPSPQKSRFAQPGAFSSPGDSPPLPAHRPQPAFEYDDTFDESFELPQASSPLKSAGMRTPQRRQAKKRDITPKEDLLKSEDYNSVFKSRPKIAVSPPFSPELGSERSEETPRRGDKVARRVMESESEMDEDEVMEFIESPLINRYR